LHRHRLHRRREERLGHLVAGLDLRPDGQLEVLMNPLARRRSERAAADPLSVQPLSTFARQPNMKNKTLTRNGVLLASSALVAVFGAPSLAQALDTAQAAAPAAAVALNNDLNSDLTDDLTNDQVSQTPATQLGDIVVLGRNIPEPNR